MKKSIMIASSFLLGYLSYSAGSKPPQNPGSQQATPQRTITIKNSDLGNACTVIYVRHGNKNRNSRQDLSFLGLKQAADLALSLKTFEKEHGSISNVIYSTLERTQQTAEAFTKGNTHKYNRDMKDVYTPSGKQLPPLEYRMSVMLRECDGLNGSDVPGYSTCKAQIDDFIDDHLMPLCRSRKVILIAGHGTFGTILFSKLNVDPANYAFPDGVEARPYVLSSDNGRNFTLIRDASRHNNVKDNF